MAKAFGESIDWVAGLAPPKRQPEVDRWDDDTRAFADQYQAMNRPQRALLRKLYETAVGFSGGLDTNYGDLDVG